jgi:YARHG domain
MFFRNALVLFATFVLAYEQECSSAFANKSLSVDQPSGARNVPSKAVKIIMAGTSKPINPNEQAGPQAKCEALWVERASYYKDAGYCFKTQAAIRYFGNEGCRYDDIKATPLSRSARARIAAIQRTEKQLGCDVTAP